MAEKEIGTEGMGSQTFTKYPAEGASVTPFGGNEAIHDGVRTEEKGTGAKVDPLMPGQGE